MKETPLPYIVQSIRGSIVQLTVQQTTLLDWKNQECFQALRLEMMVDIQASSSA
jgi:hypothetical protein